MVVDEPASTIGDISDRMSDRLEFIPSMLNSVLPSRQVSTQTRRV